jgi:hypothetical protein
LQEIQTAESFYLLLAQAREVIVTDTTPHLYAQRLYAPGLAPTGKTGTVMARVVLDEGRWVVHCPFCPSAQAAACSDRFFYCVECFNNDVGRKSVAVTWPDEQERIEELLLRRDRKQHANWFGESVEQLAAENETLGLSGS